MLYTFALILYTLKCKIILKALTVPFDLFYFLGLFLLNAIIVIRVFC